MSRIFHSFYVALVTSLLGIASGHFAAAQAPEVADLIITGGKILSCDSQLRIADAMALKGNEVIAVSSNAVVQKLAGAKTQRIDAQGRFITPGFIDSHLHLLGLGETLQQLDLSTATSWDEIIARVAEEAKNKPIGTWIEGHGFHQDKWTARPEGTIEGYPVHDLLSQAVPEHPVLLTHASGHAIMVNQLAMTLASVDSQTLNPDGGEVLRKESGEPTGLFRENADELIMAAYRKASARLTEVQRLEIARQRVQLASEECLKHGVTMVHDAGTSLRDIQLLRQLAARQQLPIRASVMIRDARRNVIDWLDNHAPWQSEDHFLQVRSVKLSIDGALGSHGAWLLEPYYDLNTSVGLNTISLDELEEIAARCIGTGWQLCVHAIGDRANREVLDCFERTFGGKRVELRWRIEHAQHLHPLDIPRFAGLGVIPAMQANHCTSDAVFVPQRLGNRRSAEGAYVWRSLLDSGSIIANGTDAPVERVDPRASLHAAVTRRLANGQQFYPNQCMKRDEALLSYTLWSATACFSESIVGSLEPGKLADFVIWDRDLLSCEPEQIQTAQVLVTYVDGKQVYLKSNN
jgi:predicted amidohydrolase YtcJ